MSKIDAYLGNVDTRIHIPKVEIKKDESSFDWKNIFIKTLSSEDRLLKNREVVLLNFPQIADDKEIYDLVVKAAAALNHLTNKENPPIKSYKGDGKGYYFGLSEWFENNEPKIKYRPGGGLLKKFTLSV